jgi:quinol monooxygenase YgiN
MVILSIHYTFAPEDADRAAALFRELRDRARGEPGCLTFDVARSQDKPHVFALWEEYRDDAALKAHLETEHFKRLALSGIRPLAKERLAETLSPLE